MCPHANIGAVGRAECCPVPVTRQKQHWATQLNGRSTMGRVTWSPTDRSLNSATEDSLDQLLQQWQMVAIFWVNQMFHMLVLREPQPRSQQEKKEQEQSLLQQQCSPQKCALSCRALLFHGHCASISQLWIESELITRNTKWGPCTPEYIQTTCCKEWQTGIFLTQKCDTFSKCYAVHSMPECQMRYFAHLF